MKLIALTDEHIINPEEISAVIRCGNYTDVWLRFPSGASRLLQIWDEDKKLWDAIRANSVPVIDSAKINF